MEDKITRENARMQVFQQHQKTKPIASKLNLSLTLSEEKRTAINPRKVFFVECFFHPQRSSYFKSKEFKKFYGTKLHPNNLEGYMNKINKEAGEEIIKKFRKHKEVYYWVDWNCSLLNPNIEYYNAHKDYKGLDNAGKMIVHEIYRRTEFANNVFGRISNFVPHVPTIKEIDKDRPTPEERKEDLAERKKTKKEFEKMKSVSDLKKNLLIEFGSLNSIFKFLEEFGFEIPHHKDVIRKTLQIDITGIPSMKGNKGTEAPIIKNLEQQKKEFKEWIEEDKLVRKSWLNYRMQKDLENASEEEKTMWLFYGSVWPIMEELLYNPKYSKEDFKREMINLILKL